MPNDKSSGGDLSTIKIRAKRQQDFVQLRLLISHPMDTGRNKNPDTGMAIPAHFIQSLRIEHNGKPVLQSQLSTGISSNPYFALRLRGTRSGDRVSVFWTDNLGQSDSAETTLE